MRRSDAPGGRRTQLGFGVRSVRGRLQRAIRTNEYVQLHAAVSAVASSIESTLPAVLRLGPLSLA